MNIVSDEVIAARAGWSRELKRGQVLRLVDLEGRQAVDFLCYNAHDREERYSAPNTIKAAGTVSLTRGHILYSGPGAAAVHDRRGHLRLARHHRRLLQRAEQSHALWEVKDPAAGGDSSKSRARSHRREPHGPQACRALRAHPRSTPALPPKLAELALLHHERQDGSGYPRGLQVPGDRAVRLASRRSATPTTR